MSPMRFEDIHRICVIGSGTMGHGIAEVAALAGYAVVLHDLSPKFSAGGFPTSNGA